MQFLVLFPCFPGSSENKPCLQCQGPGFNPWVRKIPWRRKWQPTPVLLPRKSHGWRSLVGYSPCGHKESDMTERLHFTSLVLFTLIEFCSSWVILYRLFECLIFLMDARYYKFCFAECWIIYIPINNPELYFGVQLGHLESV